MVDRTQMTREEVNSLASRIQTTLYKAHEFHADLDTLDLLLRLNRRLVRMWHEENQAQILREAKAAQ